MSSPFPGMNPYLEQPALWTGIHHRLITAIANSLAPQIRPKYIVAIEERVYEISGEETLLVGIPDVSVQRSQTATNITQSSIAIASPPTKPITVTVPMPESLTESYLEIRQVGTEEVITTIEILSPKNKQSGIGRQQYETKRRKVLGSFTHLVEIDLLRQWEPMLVFAQGIQSSYRILVSRSDTRPKADLYAFNLQDVIPLFPVPLCSEDESPLVNLQRLIHEIYNQGGYDLRIDYCREPVPVLSQTDGVWVERLLRQQELRGKKAEN